MDAASGSRCTRTSRRFLGANLSTVAERTMKYGVHDQVILVDGQPVARIEVLPGELNDAKVADLMSAANRGTGRQGPGPTPAQPIPGLVKDIDETGAGGFLAAHYVPIIGPDMGIELIKVVKRLEVVHGVYPLPPTVEVYRLALHLVLQVAAEHQRVFCAKLEEGAWRIGLRGRPSGEDL